MALYWGKILTPRQKNKLQKSTTPFHEQSIWLCTLCSPSHSAHGYPRRRLLLLRQTTVSSFRRPETLISHNALQLDLTSPSWLVTSLPFQPHFLLPGFQPDSGIFR
ncbi:hypothetical protein L2E82_12597 [Cichorium intybus]|uniref:Uncharacterized protein n=1 Tax=Cichorium intybus TaxID=13427 RepID=A0ACB9GHR7_CICIN|nr:hypothetical protein L2E82_12597 [Cichorium intybus]